MYSTLFSVSLRLAFTDENKFRLTEMEIIVYIVRALEVCRTSGFEDDICCFFLLLWLFDYFRYHPKYNYTLGLSIKQF